MVAACDRVVSAYAALMSSSDSIAVYAGTHMDCVLLQLELAGNGIEVQVEQPLGDSGVGGIADSHVFVKPFDLKRATPIVQSFKEREAGRHI